MGVDRLLLKAIGLFFIIIGLVLNPLVVEYFFSPDQQLDYGWKYVFILVFNIAMITVGLQLMKRSDYLLSKIMDKVWLERLVGNILLSMVTIVVLLFFLELGLRGWYVFTFSGSLEDAYQRPEIPVPGSTVTLGDMVRPSPYEKIIYEFKPGLDVYRRGKVVTNSKGWREQEFSEEKTQKTIRIIGIGDSHMFGWGVEQEERYMDLLEKKLNEEYPNFNWEVLVFALPGYNLVMEVEVLKIYALKYEPDLVVYSYVSNDFCLPGFLRKKSDVFSSNLFIRDFFKQVNYFEHFFFWNTEEETPFWEMCTKEEAPPKYLTLAGEENFLIALNELAGIGESKNIPVALFSEHRELPSQIYVPQSMYSLSAVPEFEEFLTTHTWEEFLIGNGDTHPNKEGHMILADALFTRLQEKGIFIGIMDSRNEVDVVVVG